MKKLISSSEAADILGLSLQGIHYRIKKGQLKSLKKDGKTYVYIDQELINKKDPKESPSQETQISSNTQQQSVQNPSSVVDEFQKIALKSKDEQIEILKHTLKLIKKQYKSEIHRLDKNHKQTLKVFQSEVELLKSAFGEMKNIYQMEHKAHHTRQLERDIVPRKRPSSSSSMKFMDIKDFFKYMKNHNKTDAQIKGIILDRIKHGDKRFIYKKDTKEVLIYKNDFFDLI